MVSPTRRLAHQSHRSTLADKLLRFLHVQYYINCSHTALLAIYMIELPIMQLHTIYMLVWRLLLVYYYAIPILFFFIALWATNNSYNVSVIIAWFAHSTINFIVNG